MWLSDDEVPQIVSLPDPTFAMTEAFVEALDSFTDEEKGQVLEYCFEYLDSDFTSITESLALPALPDDGLPEGFLDEAPASVSELFETVALTEARWRLDVVHALMGYYLETHRQRGIWSRMREFFAR